MAGDNAKQIEDWNGVAGEHWAAEQENTDRLIRAFGEAALRAAGFVLDRRDAQWIYYRLHPDLPAWMREVLAACRQALAEQPPFCADRAALTDMPNRPQRRCAA